MNEGRLLLHFNCLCGGSGILGHDLANVTKSDDVDVDVVEVYK
jgi:hypothetical protein